MEDSILKILENHEDLKTVFVHTKDITNYREDTQKNINELLNSLD